MSQKKPRLQFHYKGVLNKPVTPTSPAIYTKERILIPGEDYPSDKLVDKPEGFRIPLIYFSWGVLKGHRSAHLHPDNDEILVVLSGKATIGLIGPGKPKDRFTATYDVSAGDVVLFPQGWVHYVEDKSGPEDPVKVLVVFNNQDFKAVEVETVEEKMAHGENA